MESAEVNAIIIIIITLFFVFFFLPKAGPTEMTEEILQQVWEIHTLPYPYPLPPVFLSFLLLFPLSLLPLVARYSYHVDYRA